MPCVPSTTSCIAEVAADLTPISGTYTASHSIVMVYLILELDTDLLPELVAGCCDLVALRAKHSLVDTLIKTTLAYHF